MSVTAPRSSTLMVTCFLLLPTGLLTTVYVERTSTPSHGIWR
jgi:hypothetical protein